MIPLLTVAVLYVAGLCWCAWRDHLDHLKWLRHQRLLAAGKHMANAFAAMGPVLAAFGAAAAEAARAWEVAFQRLSAQMVSMAEVVGSWPVAQPCVECGEHHPNSGYSGPCTYGFDGCVESAACGSIIVLHTRDHTADVGPSETIHDADTPPTPPTLTHPVDNAYTVDWVWAEIDYDERASIAICPECRWAEPACSCNDDQQVNTDVRDDWGSRLRDERHSARDGAGGMTLDELLGDIDDVIGDTP